MPDRGSAGRGVRPDRQGEEDAKILAVPVTDPWTAAINDLGDHATHTLREIEHFYLVYKDLEGARRGPSDHRGMHGPVRNPVRPHDKSLGYSRSRRDTGLPSTSCQTIIRRNSAIRSGPAGSPGSSLRIFASKAR